VRARPSHRSDEESESQGPGSGTRPAGSQLRPQNASDGQRSEEQEHVVQLLVYSMAFALSGRVNYATVRREATRFQAQAWVQAKMLIK